MDRARLLVKFRPEGQFEIGAHLLKILRIWGAFELLLIPLNCLANLSMHFHYHQVAQCLSRSSRMSCGVPTK